MAQDFFDCQEIAAVLEHQAGYCMPCEDMRTPHGLPKPTIRSNPGSSTFYFRWILIFVMDNFKYRYQTN